MKFRSLMTAICVLATANIVSAAPFAYVANSGTRNVSIIDTATDTITGTVPLPDTNPTLHPYAYGVAVGSSGQKVYVGLQDTNEVAVIDAATKSVIKRIGLGTDSPGGLAVNDAETRLYVSSSLSNTLIVIDISGTGAAEVGRVSVDDSAVSNPNGVVINANGTKAYVASTSTGNVAEIALDETNNVYNRTATIPLGGTQPMGLALSSDGNTLYASSLSGDVRAIKLADNTVNNLKNGIGEPATIGNGNLALVVKADGSKVYAPSNSVDKLNVIDSSAAPNIVVGTDYAVAAGPYGISATPDGSKLYLTMNTSTAGESVKVFDTASNTVTATIALPTLAKPTSFGNFVGPLFTNTITSSDDNTNCVISPEGAIPVNNKGRTFSSTAVTGACEVKVDGVSVGQPSVYTFSNVTANHTINASPAPAGTYYTLTVDWTPNSSDRWMESTPAGININSKSAKYLSGTQVTIGANTGFSASNWTGACAGVTAPTCTVTMDADKTAAAVINLGGGTGPVKNVTKGTYHQTIDEAIAAASTNDEIRVTKDYVGSTVTTSGTATMVAVKGGYDSTHTTRAATDFTDVGNTLTVVGPGIIADQLTI